MNPPLVLHSIYRIQCFFVFICVYIQSNQPEGPPLKTKGHLFFTMLCKLTNPLFPLKLFALVWPTTANKRKRKKESEQENVRQKWQVNSFYIVLTYIVIKCQNFLLFTHTTRVTRERWFSLLPKTIFMNKSRTIKWTTRWTRSER